MLGSPFEAEDAVQDTFVRAWRGIDRFEGRSALKSWLYRIATNVCLDMLGSRERRARPMDLGPAQEPVLANLHTRPDESFVEPIPDALVAQGSDPAEIAATRDSVRLALVAALQHLPPRQRAALILCEVLRWKASEVAELLDTTVASVNSALQRARATLDEQDLSAEKPLPLDQVDREMLARYVAAFEAYDVDALTSLIREDATQSMPPFDMWLAGRDDVLTWWFGPGIGCKGSRVIPAGSANGAPGLRPVQAERDRLGLRPVGAPGAPGDGDRHRRVHVLPRHEAALPALRAPAPPLTRRGSGLVPERPGPARDERHAASRRSPRARSGRSAPEARARRRVARSSTPQRRASSLRRASASTVAISAGSGLASQTTISRGAMSQLLTLRPGRCETHRGSSSDSPGRSTRTSTAGASRAAAATNASSGRRRNRALGEW